MVHICSSGSLCYSPVIRDMEQPAELELHAYVLLCFVGKGEFFTEVVCGL